MGSRWRRSTPSAVGLRGSALNPREAEWLGSSRELQPRWLEEQRGQSPAWLGTKEEQPGRKDSLMEGTPTHTETATDPWLACTVLAGRGPGARGGDNCWDPGRAVAWRAGLGNARRSRGFTRLTCEFETRTEKQPLDLSKWEATVASAATSGWEWGRGRRGSMYRETGSEVDGEALFTKMGDSRPALFLEDDLTGRESGGGGA